MKKHNNHVLTALLIPFIIAVVCNIPGCYTKVSENKDGGDYQIYISSPDTLTIKDGSREVGKIFFTDDSEIGNLLQADNQ